MAANAAARDIYIGLMSGTSGDGMDAAAVEFTNAGISILGCRSHSYSSTLRSEIRDAASLDAVPVLALLQLDQTLGRLGAQLVEELLAESGLEAADICAIGSHGQTIRHLPEIETTWQIGNPNLIAQHTGICTVADIRRRDMAAGGEGAPLAPAFHYFAFGSAIENRVILNLGGIGNITFLPKDSNAKVFGYDTGPSNRLMDHWVQLKKNKPFDEGGAWAASGRANAELLQHMLKEPYFAQLPPKSTGPETFSAAWLAHHLSAIAAENLADEDVQATLCELTVTSIAREIQQLASGVDAVYLCGGGVYNQHLTRRLQIALGPLPLKTTDDLGIPAMLVEPAAFAWIARQTLRGQAGNLPTVTGARDSAILGAIYPAAVICP